MTVTGYVPLYLPGDAISLTALSAITAGQLLAVAGDDLVAPVAVTGQQWVGVAGTDAKVGERVTVYGRGTVHSLAADGPVAAGDLLVASGTAGRAVAAARPAATPPTAADVETTRAACGVALRGAADGAACVWMAL